MTQRRKVEAMCGVAAALVVCCFLAMALQFMADPDPISDPVPVVFAASGLFGGLVGLGGAVVASFVLWTWNTGGRLPWWRFSLLAALVIGVLVWSFLHGGGLSLGALVIVLGVVLFTIPAALAGSFLLSLIVERETKRATGRVDRSHRLRTRVLGAAMAVIVLKFVLPVFDAALSGLVSPLPSLVRSTSPMILFIGLLVVLLVASTWRGDWGARRR